MSHQLHRRSAFGYLLCAICYCSVAPAPLLAQTAKPRAELYQDIATEMASGQPVRPGAPTGGMTAAQARGVVSNVVASAVLSTETYADPSWLASLHWSKLTNKPTSIAGLGVLNGAALDTIAANGSSHYLDRANHTGTQLAATISDFATAAASAAPVQSVAGKTGTVTLAKADVGLANVDNTADTAKPISLATQAALDAKASLAALAATNAGGVNNGGLVHWTQLMGVPAGFADGTDDGASGSSYTFTAPLVNTTGTISITAATGSAAGSMSAADKTKLDGIATNATANASDAALRDRSTHTGEQAISTVTGLQSALDGKAAASHGHAIADTTGLQSALDGKLATSGTAADVNPAGTAIAAALASKLGASAQAVDVNPSGTAIAAALAGKSDSGHGHSNATTSAAGFMSASDKSKLDGVASNATAYANSNVLAYLLSILADGQYLKRSGSALAGDTPAGGSGSGFLFKTAGSVENINGSNSETTILSGTVPGGTLGTNKAIGVVLFGTYTNNTAANQSASLKIKYGGTTIYTGGTSSIGTNATSRPWRLEFKLFADGATNAQRMESTGLPIGPVGTTPPLSGTAGNGQQPIHAACAIDSTVDQTLEVTITLSTNTAGSSWVTHQGVAWKLYQ